MKRTIPFSHEKEKRRSMVLYYKMKLRELKGIVIEKDLMAKRKERANMKDVEISTINEVEEQLEKAKRLWNKVIEKDKEMRKKELLDYHHEEIIGDDVKLIKKRKKILARIKNKMRRNHTFHYISRHIGKGVRENIKQLHLMNFNNEVE